MGGRGRGRCRRSHLELAKREDELQDATHQEVPGAAQQQYLLCVVLCEYLHGTPAPEDDAEQAEWIPVAEIATRGLQLLDQVPEVALAAQARWRELARNANPPTR